jgi:hypothetical protein
MRFTCGFCMSSVFPRLLGQMAVPAIFLFCPVGDSLAASQDDSPCRAKLSKKGVMIFDEVQQKRTSDTNLEDLWKEVTRDLITANRLGREEATAPAMEALACLRAPE